MPVQGGGPLCLGGPHLHQPPSSATAPCAWPRGCWELASRGEEWCEKLVGGGGAGGGMLGPTLCLTGLPCPGATSPSWLARLYLADQYNFGTAVRASTRAVRRCAHRVKTPTFTPAASCPSLGSLAATSAKSPNRCLPPSISAPRHPIYTRTRPAWPPLKMTHVGGRTVRIGAVQPPPPALKPSQLAP